MSRDKMEMSPREAIAGGITANTPPISLIRHCIQSIDDHLETIRLRMELCLRRKIDIRSGKPARRHDNSGIRKSLCHSMRKIYAAQRSGHLNVGEQKMYLLIGFVITGAFNLGVGTLLPRVAKIIFVRRIAINTIGPLIENIHSLVSRCCFYNVETSVFQRI